ncbi:MAG: glycosyltransferase family 4 protein [Ginsengibacter sp.]
MESTIPLAKYLAREGVEIDLYCLLPQSGQNTYVFDFLKNPQPNGFVDANITKETLGKKLCQYLSGTQLKNFIIPDGRYDRLFLKDLYSAYKFARHLKKKKYDLIHIIHSSRRFWLFLYFFIPKRKIIQTLHEVTSHDGESDPLDLLPLKWLIKNATPVIFHSNISKNRFIEFRESISTKRISDAPLALIRFGLFETYHYFNTNLHPVKNKEINILNFGRIVPSKGIHLLIDAVRLLQDKYPIHLTVAGDGKPYFDFKGIKNYEFINRFIPNEEIVSLIEDCDIVVIPYTSASQSGIPMTVYAFNKPIIASNIAGLKEVIDNQKTGILVDNISASSLAASIESLLSDTNLRNEMAENIKKKYTAGEFSWPHIAKQTLSFYSKQLEGNKDIKK